MSFQLYNNRLVSEKGVLMPAPRSDRPDRKERFWLVKCNFCGETRWLRKTDVLKDAPCRSCSAVINTTTTSMLEEEVASVLTEHKVEFVRHVPIIEEDVKYNVDFYIPLHNLYIEVVGYWHRQTKLVKDKVLQSKLYIWFISTISELKSKLKELVNE